MAATFTRFDVLYLWFLENPAIPRFVGTLRLLASKGVSLQYDERWLTDSFPLSEDLPLVDTEHRPRRREAAAGAVDDARPDRWGERVIQFIDKPPRLSLMEYLYFAGDERFGALGVSTSATQYEPRRVGPLPRLESAQELSDIVAKIEDKEPITRLQEKLLAAGGSFGGAKPKALIEIDDVQWVLKFFNNETVDLPLIEHATMTLCAKADITVSETRAIRLAGEHAIAVRRFDRDAGRRIHSVSAGTALRALTPGEPDLSYPALAQLLRRTGPTVLDLNQRDMAELFRRMVFNILVDNTDDHEKNHSLLVIPKDDGRPAATRINWLRLAPAYDVVPTNSGQGYHEFGIGTEGRDATLANAMSQCEQFGLTSAEAAQSVIKVIGVVNGWQTHFAKCGVSAADVRELAIRIDGDELRMQRESFNPADYASAPAKKRPKSPFAR